MFFGRSSVNFSCSTRLSRLTCKSRGADNGRLEEAPSLSVKGRLKLEARTYRNTASKSHRNRASDARGPTKHQASEFTAPSAATNRLAAIERATCIKARLAYLLYTFCSHNRSVRISDILSFLAMAASRSSLGFAVRTSLPTASISASTRGLATLANFKIPEIKNEPNVSSRSSRDPTVPLTLVEKLRKGLARSAAAG